MFEKKIGDSMNRRTIVKGAAWSVPVVALAVAAPSAAASGNPVAATFWGTSATASVISGNTTKYVLDGQDALSDPALLPIGSQMTLTPGPGVTLTMVRSSAGVLVEPQTDGSIIVTIIAADITEVDLRFSPVGPAGSGYTITTSVPNIAPFTEDINVVLQ
ncbi:hypothetical protein CQ018_19005 [Arthrobacter sp. MYb227]|nr:hypothetical protein CQ018_19005 [Arthrobacter sp. MYb227]